MNKSAREQSETVISHTLNTSLRVRQGLAAAGFVTSAILGTHPGNDTYIAAGTTLAVFTSVGVAEQASAKKRCHQSVASYAISRNVAVGSIENRVRITNEGVVEEFDPYASTDRLMVRGMGANATGFLTGLAGYTIASAGSEQVDAKIIAFSTGLGMATSYATKLLGYDTNDRIRTYGQQLENIDQQASSRPIAPESASVIDV